LPIATTKNLSKPRAREAAGSAGQSTRAHNLRDSHQAGDHLSVRVKRGNAEVTVPLDVVVMDA
jgi:hypothetical protein